jgi:hypothetical protein
MPRSPLGPVGWAQSVNTHDIGVQSHDADPSACCDNRSTPPAGGQSDGDHGRLTIVRLILTSRSTSDATSAVASLRPRAL